MEAVNCGHSGNMRNYNSAMFHNKLPLAAMTRYSAFRIHNEGTKSGQEPKDKHFSFDLGSSNLEGDGPQFNILCV